ncbi:phospholipid transfer protein-like isoform X3 [Thunnus thynnus]|uniref:phospholipid transfer protein-like isoform X3 n=1 Tax=Thunnus thynnus TaxID=8237 RepID=UPI0035298F46
MSRYQPVKSKLITSSQGTTAYWGGFGTCSNHFTDGYSTARFVPPSVFNRKLNQVWMNPKPAQPRDRCAIQTVKTKNTHERLDISKEVFRRRGGNYFFFCLLEQELKFCPAVQEYAVPKINAMLESITMTKKLHESYNLDYHLSSNITVTPSCLNVPFRGVFFRQGETVDLSSIKSCMDPVFSESYRMAYVGFSEFFFNSIAMSLQKTGPFKLTIPKLSYLKERALAAVGLSTGRIKVKLAQSPTVRISRNGVSATVNARVQSLARPANKNPTVPVDCQVDIKVDIKGNRLILRSTKPVKCKLKPKTFTGRFMALFVNIGINKYITGTLKRLIEGLLIPLPEGVHYTEGKIDYHDGFVVIGGSLNFTPAGRRTVLKRIGRV